MNRLLRSSKRITGWLVLALLAACSGPQAAQPVQPLQPSATALPAPTDTAAPTATLTPTPDSAATRAAQQTAEAQATVDAQAAASTRAALDKIATRTAAFSHQGTATAGVKATATANAGAYLTLIDRLKQEGVVTSEGGEYHHLEDFDESWAQLLWYRWWDTGYAAENFVLSADVAWQSASDTADWYWAGCGFVFSNYDENNWHVVWLSLDGNGVVARVNKTKAGGKLLAVKRYGTVSVPDGSAKLMLVVDDQRIKFYVNDKLTTSAYDSAIKEGQVALTLLSGTNKDFGTRCQMTNVELFILE